MRCNHLIWACLLVLTLSSCGLSSGKYGKYASYTGELPDTAVAAMSWEASEQITALYPPGRTSIYLNHPQNSVGKPIKNVFDELFETNLRANGFRIAAESNVDIPYITWRVDTLPNEFGSPNWYLWMHVYHQGKNLVFSRVYNDQGLPVSSFVNGVLE